MSMEKIEGMKDAFKKAKSVFLTTFKDGGERSRVMTNFNEDPYSTIWFPTEKGTRKVKDIKENPKVLITFPGEKPGEFYEITGKAWFEEQEVVNEKWEWWWLYWHPSQKDRFWINRTKNHPKRVIINIKPISARLLRKPVEK